MAIGNTAIRIVVSIIAIPIILAICIYGEIPFLLFSLGISLIAFWEFCGLARNKNINPNVLVGGVSVLAVILNAYFNMLDFYILVLIISVVTLLYELFRDNGSAIQNVGSTLLGVFYIGLFSSSLIMIREYFSYSGFLYSEGGYLIVSILVSIWVCDSAAFFLGSAFGKHKLFPRVSPNKTWEGAIAGFIFAVITMIFAKATVIDTLSLLDTIIIGLIIGFFGQLGDLIESLIKRDADLKDSSSIIPGHGGVFDRFDSLLLTAPIVYSYLYFIN